MIKQADPKPIKAALFPIPEMVTFPNTKVPLHVFEPRYRVMVKHCLEEQMMLGISHTKKMKGNARYQNQPNDEQMLNKNLASYEPHEVFSAGFCELIETTEDGRLHIEVNLTHRLQRLNTDQEIPFQIVNCKELHDQLDRQTTQQETDKKQDIYAVLLAISESQSPQLHKIISQAEWRDSTPAEFSFKVFQYFKFEADFMQFVLEQTSINMRLDLIWQGINQSLQR